jgi:hypothetical protein
MTLAVFALVGCAPKPAPIVPSVSPNAPITTPKTALSGVTTRVNFVSLLNPDCTVRAIATIRVVTQPQHGLVNISEIEDFSSYPPINPRSACNKNKSRGNKIEYTAAPGYVGPDYLSYEAISDDGQDKVFNVPLTIK